MDINTYDQFIHQTELREMLVEIEERRNIAVLDSSARDFVGEL